MKKIVLFIASILALCPYNLSLVCPTTPIYNTTITQMCYGKNVNVLWPDYTNTSQRYWCSGEGNPILETCPPNTVFDFSQQTCTTCDKYVPAQPCPALKANVSCKAFTPPKTPVTTPASVPICYNLHVYNTTFVPTCVGYDIYRHWPDYKNASQFWWCQGLYNPKIKACAPGTYFNFVKQICTDCDSYVAAVECSKLIMDKSNKCEKI